MSYSLSGCLSRKPLLDLSFQSHYSSPCHTGSSLLDLITKSHCNLSLCLPYSKTEPHPSFSFSLYNLLFSSPSVLQGRCTRDNCKYLHPPPHLKTQLEINGRNNLIQQKNMVMLAQQMQLANVMMPGTQLPPMVGSVDTHTYQHTLAPTHIPEFSISHPNTHI